MNIQQLDKMLSESKGFTTVTFVKKDGTMRTINGLFNTSKGKAPSKQCHSGNNNKVIYSVPDKGYRIINLATVARVSINKQVYHWTAEGWI
jgi:hypothetical protein